MYLMPRSHLKQCSIILTYCFSHLNASVGIFSDWRPLTNSFEGSVVPPALRVAGIMINWIQWICSKLYLSSDVLSVPALQKPLFDIYNLLNFTFKFFLKDLPLSWCLSKESWRNLRSVCSASIGDDDWKSAMNMLEAPSIVWCVNVPTLLNELVDDFNLLDLSLLVFSFVYYVMW